MNKTLSALALAALTVDAVTVTTPTVATDNEKIEFADPPRAGDTPIKTFKDQKAFNDHIANIVPNTEPCDPIADPNNWPVAPAGIKDYEFPPWAKKLMTQKWCCPDRARKGWCSNLFTKRMVVSQNYCQKTCFGRENEIVDTIPKERCERYLNEGKCNKRTQQKYKFWATLMKRDCVKTCQGRENEVFDNGPIKGINCKDMANRGVCHKNASLKMTEIAKHECAKTCIGREGEIHDFFKNPVSCKTVVEYGRCSAKAGEYAQQAKQCNKSCQGKTGLQDAWKTYCPSMMTKYKCRNNWTKDKCKKTCHDILKNANATI